MTSNSIVLADRKSYKVILRDPPSRIVSSEKLMKLYKWLPVGFANIKSFKNFKLLTKNRVLSNSLYLKIKNRQVVDIARLSKKFRNIHSLRLDITNDQKFDDRALFALSKCLKNLGRLKDFHLIASNAHSRLTDKGINYLVRKFSRNRLTSTKLFLSRIPNLTDNGLKLVAKFLKKTKILTKFHLEIAECENISNEAVNFVAEGLSNSPQLNSLALFISDYNQVNKQAFLNLTQQLTNLQQLKSLQIDLSNYSDDETFRDMVQHLTELRHLTKLGLRFELRPVSDGRIDEMSKIIGRTPSLRKLAITLPWCNELSDKGIDVFVKNITNMKKLTHLKLEFWRCEDLTDQTIIFVIKNLGEMTNLKSLCLSFNMFPNLTNQGMALLSQLPPKLQNLSSFYIIFRQCNQIDDEGAQTIFEKISNIKTLKNKMVLFLRCLKVNLEMKLTENCTDPTSINLL